MSRLQDAMPNVNWDAWNNIEPTFRGVAEWEFSVLHAKAQRSAAQKSWWELNDNQVRECLELSVSPATRTVSSIQTASAKPALPQNPRYEQIERREKLEREAVDHVVAPEPIKQQARQQIRDAAAVDRYLADLGSKP
jgi:hypothetical protein